MSKFPIIYSERSGPGQSGSVRLNLDVDKGDTLVTRAVSDFGAAGLKIAEGIRNAENAAELSGFKRKSNDIWNAAYNTVQKTSDPDEREKILQQAKLDANAQVSTQEDVNAQYKMYRNETEPQWDRWYGDLDRGMRKQQSRDSITFNGMKQLEQGDLLGYIETLNTGFNAQLYTQEEYDFLKENSAINMVFAQARVEMDGNPEMALLKLNNLKDLSGAQLDERDKLISYATSKRNGYNAASETLRSKTNAEYHAKIINGDTNIQQMSNEILNLQGLTDIDRVELAKAVELQFRNWGTTISNKSSSTIPAQRNMTEALDGLQEGRMDKNDYFKVLAENKSGLKESDISMYVKESEEAWDQYVNTTAKLADDSVKGQIITISDAFWEAQTIKLNRGNMETAQKVTFNAQSMQREAQSVIYAEYKQAVFDLKKKDLPRKEYTDQLKVLNSMYAGKSWARVYETNDAMKSKFKKQSKAISSEFDALLNKKGAFYSIPISQQTAVIEKMADNMPLVDILAGIESGEF